MLARAFSDRYEHSDGQVDVDKQIACATYALALSPDNPIDALLALGSALVLRHKRLRSTQDIEAALQVLTYAHTSSAMSQGDLPSCLFELGKVLLVYYEEFGDTDNLTQSLALLQDALQLVGEEHPLRCRIAYALATGHNSVYLKSGKVEIAEKAAQLIEEVVHLCPRGHPFRPHALLGFGRVLAEKYRRAGGPATLDLSIQTFHDGLAACLSQTHSLCTPFLSSLSNFLRTRYAERGLTVDLDDAISYGKRGLILDPESSILLTNLGIALVTRFMKTGAFADLEDSTHCFRRSLSYRPPGHPRRDFATNNLGANLILRFEHSLNFSDLTEGISLLYETASYRPLGHPEWASIQHNIANALKTRYTHTNNLEDLELALATHDHWMSNLSDSHSASGWREEYGVHNIAELRRLRYNRLGSVQDLDTAINMQEGALQQLAEDHRVNFLTTNELALAYQLRATQLQSMEDAHKAHELFRDALARTPIGHSDRAYVLLGLSRLHLQHLLPDQDAGSALELYCTAITDGHCTAQRRLSEGLPVLPLLQQSLSGTEDYNGGTKIRLLDAYRLTVHLLPQIAYFGLDVPSRFHVLGQAPNLAADAAVYALTLPNSEAAIELLEEGRAVFWVQHLRLRTSFDGLPLELAGELTAVSQSLDSGSRLDTPPSRHDADALALYEEKLSQRHRLSEHFEHLVTTARSLPGFDRFMLNDTFAVLRSAATATPIVVLLATDSSCGALLLRNSSSTVQHISFGSDVTARGLIRYYYGLHTSRRMVRTASSQRGMKPSLGAKERLPHDLLSMLWHQVMKPVVDAIGLQVSYRYTCPG